MLLFIIKPNMLSPHHSLSCPWNLFQSQLLANTYHVSFLVQYCRLPCIPHVNDCRSSAFLTTCIMENGVTPCFVQTILHRLPGRIGSQWARKGGSQYCILFPSICCVRGNVLDLNHTSHTSMIFHAFPLGKKKIAAQYRLKMYSFIRKFSFFIYFLAPILHMPPILTGDMLIIKNDTQR